jgi:hypothetical protein
MHHSRLCAVLIDCKTADVDEDRCGPQQCDVPASTSGAPPRESNAQHRITTDSSDSITSWIGSKDSVKSAYDPERT